MFGGVVISRSVNVLAMWSFCHVLISYLSEKYYCTAAILCQARLQLH